MPKVELNGQSGYIPAENISAFAQENPDAIIHYQVDDKQVAIPAKNKDSFIKDYPHAIGVDDYKGVVKPQKQNFAITPEITMTKLS